MKTIRFLATILFLVSTFNNLTAQTPQNILPVEVYYFHATNRCVTCEAVEAVTKEALKQFYGDQIVLKSINREEDKTNPLIKKHKIAGQTLLILKGDKAENLTNFAFMNARTNPDKLKKKIKETIEKM
ncbi:MAG: nitrophenyl compound nitroreductase subunit ArsF family protein [Prolixibacteraceae bacterium]